MTRTTAVAATMTSACGSTKAESHRPVPPGPVPHSAPLPETDGKQPLASGLGQRLGRLALFRRRLMLCRFGATALLIARSFLVLQSFGNARLAHNRHVDDDHGVRRRAG